MGGLASAYPCKTPSPEQHQVTVAAELACSDVHSIIPGEVLGLEMECNADGHKEGSKGRVH